ncbi:hypothetical protein FRC01_000953 [Tulasnella sp. 417]|nr:hypothetical protein FRC01_000953 [Tulasnella sp. 417]
MVRIKPLAFAALTLLVQTKLTLPQLPLLVRNIFRPKPKVNDPKAPKIDLVNRGTPIECQKRSRFVQLPEDILLLFSHHLDKAATANVIQTCRYLHHLFVSILYTHLSPLELWYSHKLSGFPCGGSNSGRSTATQANSIGQLRRRKPVGSSDPYALHITETEPFKNALLIFTKATNMVDLDFTDYYDWASDPIFAPIKAAVFNTSLTRLYIRNWALSTEVLRAQPGLEHLEVGWNVPGLEGLDRRDIPKLRSLTGKLQDALYLVPGRPVARERLELVERHENGAFDPNLFRTLALSTRPITQLTMCAYHSWDAGVFRKALRIASPNLPHLEQLTIPVDGSTSGQLILDEMPSFQSIRRLVFLNADLDKAAAMCSKVLGIPFEPFESTLSPPRGS